MPVLDWYLLIPATSILVTVNWGFALVLLAALAYYIEKYTKFKTKWELLAIATILLLSHSIIKTYDYYTIGSLDLPHDLVANTLLLAGMLLGAYASMNLLKFQKTYIGKTRDIVEILATVGVVIPSLAYLGGRITMLNAWTLMEYNTSIVLLVLVFLIIGKIIRNYVPKHGKLVYAITVFASMLLPVNMLLRSYAQISLTVLDYREMIIFLGRIVQSTGNLLLAAAALMLIREAKIRGIHLVPTELKTVDKTPMRYRLKNGFSYMIQDTDGKKGFEIFKDNISHKHNGLGITRTNPDRVREEYGLRTTPILWMTTAETEHKMVKPTDLERLLFIIKDFISNEGDILFIEKLDYLISENGFKHTLNFIHRLNDIIVQSDCILVVSMNLDTLTMEERNQLLQEFQDLTGTDNIILNEPLYEVLSYIYTENKAGRRPSFKRITDRFDITKTTTRRRVYELENKRLVRVIDDGKFKLLEVTETGGNLMKNPVGPRGW